MYEKEIDILEHLRSVAYANEHPAIDTAIALMRSASEPEDEAEVRDRLESALSNTRGMPDAQDDEFYTIVNLIMDHRTDARTKMAGEVERLRGKVAELRACIDDAVIYLGELRNDGQAVEHVLGDLRAVLEATK